METRIRILLLTLVALASSGCSWMPWHHKSAANATVGADASPLPVIKPAASADTDSNPPTSVVEPQVERRPIKVPKIRSSDMELGVYYGQLSIEDFGTQPVEGLRFDFHLTEDLFFEATYGRATAGETSFETLSNIQLLTEAERRFTYYNLGLGYNFLPGEIFIGRNLAMTSALYLIGGVGSVKFAGDDKFTANFGAGFRVLPAKWLALHLDFQDLVFDSSVTGVNRLKNNLQATIGATVLF